MTTLLVAFRTFANAPKKATCEILAGYIYIYMKYRSGNSWVRNLETVFLFSYCVIAYEKSRS